MLYLVDVRITDDQYFEAISKLEKGIVGIVEGALGDDSGTSTDRLASD